FNTVWDQLEFRERAVREFIREEAGSVETFHAVAGRGGLLRPVEGGVYWVNKQMLLDAEDGYQGEHPANLGCALAYAFAHEMDSKAYVVDPVSTNEMADVARYSGHPAIQRKSLSHALNLHYVARKVAVELDIPLGESRFIVAHLGGGISIAPIRGGKIIDVNDATNEGPFSTTRSGSLPTVSLAEFILDSNLSYPEARGELLKNAGLFGYLHDYDGNSLARKIEQEDEEVTGVVNAMAYQIAKEIGSMSTVMQGDVDRIIITGGLANFQYLVDKIRDNSEWISRFRHLPGEFELEALAGGVQRVLTGQESPKTYPT
ncbi:MAG: butyrate kinase, partial [Candidatus Marinimicrobia bacterium]|nr:butyrate kinase [Candidatus Neomarinimicrobiota bacterium]